MTGARRSLPRGKAWLPCPGDCLDGMVRVSFVVHPGEEEVRRPNSAAHPGSPARAEVESELERDSCDCEGEYSDEEWRSLERDHQSDMLGSFDRV